MQACAQDAKDLKAIFDKQGYTTTGQNVDIARHVEDGPATGGYTDTAAPGHDYASHSGDSQMSDAEAETLLAEAGGADADNTETDADEPNANDLLADNKETGSDEPDAGDLLADNTEAKPDDADSYAGEQEYSGEADDTLLAGNITDDPFASSQSLRIDAVGGQYRLTVVRASNPVLVGQQQVQAGGSAYLNKGDTITLGHTTFTFTLTE